MALSNKDLTFFVAAAVMYQAAGWVDGDGAIFLEEGHEPEPPKRDTIAAGMLLASVVYMTATLGMASQMRDRKLRKLTLSALNTKISIFIAVLMFQAITGCFAREEEEEHPDWVGIGLTFVGVFIWFVALQVLMASINYNQFNCGWKGWMSLTSKKKNWERERELQLEFWATLMGHVVGFACIDGFAKLQLKMYQMMGGLGAWLAILVATVSMTGWYNLIKKSRKRFNETQAHKDDDSKVCKQERLERIEDAAEDTENDAIALTISFLLCQAFRLAITGILPNGEGLSERYLTVDHDHTNETGTEPAFGGPLAEPKTYTDIGCLLTMSCVSFIAVLLWRDCPCFKGMKKWFKNNVPEGDERLERVTEVVSDTASMTVAWSVYSASTWLLDTLNRRHCSRWGNDEHDNFNCGSGGMTGSVFLALSCTLLAYFMIILLRYASDVKFETQKDLWHDFSESALKAQGLLIGFSWEKSFDLAVENISDKVQNHRNLYRVLVSCVVCVMVGLVWKLFLLPQVLSHKKEDEAVEVASKVFKRIEKIGSEGYAELDEKKDKRREELKEDFEETLKEYAKQAKAAYDRALALQSQAELAIKALNDKTLYDGVDGEGIAIVCNRMTRALRRYEEIAIVEGSEE